MSHRSRHPSLVPLLAWALLAAPAPAVEGASCGSALLLEADPPAVFDDFDPSAPSRVRFWEAGRAGWNRSDDGCRTGCTALSGASCAGGGSCLALTGVTWLNATCSEPGRLPPRTVFLVEQATADSGGRWAALDLDRNPHDANTDLDERAAAVCGGCASVLSPYLGGDGRPAVTGSAAAGGKLVVELSWAAPPPAAQALSNGAGLVTGYGVHYRTGTGTPPAATGDPAGWIPVPDLGSDGAGNGGFSTDTTATVEIPLTDLQEIVTFAIGPVFDGSGDPSADPHSLASSYLSDDSEPLAVPTGCGAPDHVVLEAQTVSDVREWIGCLTLTAGNGFVVESTGDVTFRAGQRVVLGDGFSVGTGGRLTVGIDPSLNP